MFNDYLTKSGLSKDQATIYDLLLQYGNVGASKLSKLANLKRGLTYKVLDQLVELGLAEKNDKLSKIALFFPTHPSKIKELFEKKKEEAKVAEEALGAVMGQMVSTFNLASGKPNVQFFEGLEGVKKVLEDSLTTSEEILSYADIESIETHIKDINSWYVTKREKLNIKKRGFVLDTPFNRKFLETYHTDITNTKYIKATTSPFKTIMQIYDNKISYITLDKESMIGVIIEDRHIAAMHKYLFLSLWEKN